MKKEMVISAIMAGVLTVGTFTPVSNVFSPLTITAEAASIRTDFNNKILYISPYVNPSLRMDIEGGRNYNEVNCGAYYQNTGDNQKFEATLKYTDSNGTDWYRLRPLSDHNGNMGLNVNYSWGQNHGNLQLYEYSYSANMLFAFEKASDGYSYNIRAYCGGYLDVTGSYDGSNIYRNESKTYSNTQKWLVTEAASEQMTSFSFPSQPIPSSLEEGKSQVISGSISADNSPLYSVTAEIVGTQYSKTVYPSGFKYDLPYSSVDYAIQFGKLAPGSYTLRLSAVAKNGKKCSCDYKFSVSGKPAVKTTFNFPSSPIPAVLTKGKSQVISGTISAVNGRLASVSAEVIGTSYYKKEYVSAGSYSLPYSGLDNAIKFGKLNPGNYVLRLSATSDSGQSAYKDYSFSIRDNSTVSSSIGAFDIDKALSYAGTYAYSYNPTYGFYGVGGRFTNNPTSADMGENGNDCVHFVWQILREAGLNIDQKLINVSQMRNYFKPYVEYISYPSAGNIEVGDILLTSSGHATFVSKREGNNVYICSHTNARKDYQVTLFYGVIKTSKLIKTAAAETSVIYGDADGDGKSYTISDLLAVQLYKANLFSASKFNFKAADLDFDGKITNNDMQIMKLKMTGLSENDTVSKSTTADNLSISENGLSFLCGLEGFSSTCYKDGTQSSIGYGTKCPYSSCVHSSGLHSITKEQAMADMKSQINSRYAPATRKQLGGMTLTQNQFDALVSLCYNTGGGTSIISNSPLVKYLKGEITEAQARSQYAGYYVKSSGVVLPGLINRRNKEADLFFTK